MNVGLHVNGEHFQLEIDDDELLLDTLRRRLGFMSVREGCGVGACGACTVLVEGQSVSGCLVLAGRCDGKDICTSEGLGADDPVVKSFVEEGALQCGYCIPGFVLMATELLAENPYPDEQAIKTTSKGTSAGAALTLTSCGQCKSLVRGWFDEDRHVARLLRGPSLRTGQSLGVGAPLPGAVG